MSKTTLKNILIAILLVAIITAIFWYVLGLKEKLLISEQENQKLLQTLEKEKLVKQSLLNQNLGLKESLRVNRRMMGKLLADYAAAQGRLQDLNDQITLLDSQISILRSENALLLEDKQSLNQENEEYKSRFESVEELKKALDDLRHRARKADHEVQEKAASIIEGNGGFLTRRGKTDYPARVKIEVTPLSP